MQLDDHYTDTRLVAVYDIENAGRDDVEFYLALAAELGAHDVADLGCGTGVLAVELAERGHRVTGVDPSAAMLGVARQRHDAALVSWVHGEAATLEPATADLAVMTGHVAQVFLSDHEWSVTVRNLWQAIRPGGHLAFESRNPEAAAWTAWNKDESRSTFTTRAGESFESWVDVTSIGPGLVAFDGHTVFTATGEHLVSASTLRFRTRDELQASLSDAGFEVRVVYGDWHRGPATLQSAELIVVARRP